MQCWHHLFHSLLQICTGVLEDLGQSLYLLVEEALLAVLTELDDGVGLAIVQQLSVLRLEHVEHCPDARHEGHLQQTSHLLSVVEEAIDGLDASLLHFLFLSSHGLGLVQSFSHLHGSYKYSNGKARVK